MIVATAGHIDHGKTALVKALTGIDADRLPEEKARGITLDLGFAYAPAGGLLKRPLGFVDVPGHERLVRTMVAGATGVACALLAVAADDGIMPQTREHAAILDLLGLARGVVAITKSDRADPARIAAVAAEVRSLLAGTGLAAAPVIACSAVTGAGLSDLARALEAAATLESSDAASRGFRLAVDRRFTVPGAGLVVTGAVHAGRVQVGDRLLVSPGGQEVRVRAIRVRDGAAEAAQAGERCALNLTGPRLSRDAVGRGQWILTPDLHAPATRLDAALRLLPGEAHPLRHRTPVQVHLGAAAVTGRILLPPDTALAPGAVASAVIALDAGLGALAGDRFILRDISATRTLGGGRVIDLDGPRRGAWAPGRRAVLDALDPRDDRLALDRLLAASDGGVDLATFARLRNVPAAALEAMTAELAAIVVGPADRRRAFAPARVGLVAGHVLDCLDRAHREEPDNPGLLPEEIGAALATEARPALPAAVAQLLDAGTLTRRGRLLHRPDHVARLRIADAHLFARIRAELAAAGRDQPRLALLAERLGSDPEDLRPLLDKVGRIGWLCRISKGYYVPPEIVVDLARIAQDVATSHPDGLLTVGRFREAAGIGRNMTMPLLEYFDAQGFTLRIPEGRKIRTDWRAFGAGHAAEPEPLGAT
jgi:selenocysteine-specific elongation factor